MLSQSYARFIGARSISRGLLSLVVLLSVSGAGVMTSCGRPPHPGTADPTTIAPLIADTTPETGGVTRTPSAQSRYMVTEDQLANEQDYPLGSVLIAHFPGIRVIHGSAGDRVASRLNMDMKGSPCYLQVFVDGVFIADGRIEWVNVRDLAAIEYRTPGNIPVQYQNRLPGAMCGVLLLWSRTS